MFWCDVIGKKHEVRTVSLKEPKRVKAVESSQRRRPCAPTGPTKLLMMMKYATAHARIL